MLCVTWLTQILEANKALVRVLVLFHLPFSLSIFQVVEDSVSILDSVGDWPEQVVQEESNEWVSTHLKQSDNSNWHY